MNDPSNRPEPSRVVPLRRGLDHRDADHAVAARGAALDRNADAGGGSEPDGHALGSFELIYRRARERVQRAAECRGLGLALAAATLVTVLGAGAPAHALPPDFVYQTVFANLNLPSTFAFSRDGRVFVAELRGVIKVYDSILDTEPDVFADLRTQVHIIADRGLIGMALHPDFPDQPYVYVSYAYDGGIGADDSPRWGGVDTDFDDCVPLDNGCPIGGRLSRLTASGNTAVAETVLIEDWYQQFTSHSIGATVFGNDGYLYVSSGEGANPDYPDSGQTGSLSYPDVGSPPDEGGSLRSQDLETTGDPVGLSGALIRVDPMSGLAVPGNPLYTDATASETARRIVAYGLRNPFRFMPRPGSDEMWIADVGQSNHEEINVVQVGGGAGAVPNFGWPCYEGPAPQGGWEAVEAPICEAMYAGTGRFPYVAPFYSYPHETVNGHRNGSITALDFYTGGQYPAQYHDALFFADYTAPRLFVMADSDADGVPDGASSVTLFEDLGNPVVELKSGPGGDLFIAQFDMGGNPTQTSAIKRILHGSNTPPFATLVTAAGSSWQGPPREVTFDAAASIDPDSGSTDPGLQGLSFAWDLDGDGAFDDVADPSAAQASHSFASDGLHEVSVRVTDAGGATDTASMRVAVGNIAPDVQIVSPGTDTLWRTGQELTLEATASDPEDGSLPDGAFQWTITLLHCVTGPDDCHGHPQSSPTGRIVQYTPPAHEYPAFLRIQVSAADSDGAIGDAQVELDPATATLTLATEPPGLELAFGNDGSQATPFQRTVILGSAFSVAAPSVQESGGTEWHFLSWSDGGARQHLVTRETAGSFTLTATYQTAAEAEHVFGDGFE